MQRSPLTQGDTICGIYIPPNMEKKKNNPQLHKSLVCGTLKTNNSYYGIRLFVGFAATKMNTACVSGKHAHIFSLPLGLCLKKSVQFFRNLKLALVLIISHTQPTLYSTELAIRPWVFVYE